ncbi:hypothetical protein FDZ58_01335 [Ehrlichia ruminantium]|uniref:hypothetical protein n=1 Tax=Ehrlichia ruminantium TaxID=779 RepID=UPI0015DD1BED|nr:hypothetical protein [Ehrlichia ruminantium]QLK50318.1 hypothetical protein FDZ68_01335 [Ehrlichia ruminantium]QLK51242.1 hypothetical protein FDZ66_01340 [Ehrlichia ruminantium]QLK53077.1 hypothetical protein FDZ64_01335 [Ehrlichia ruminantium]QLK57660.1 hypothetical protein FDZ59_01330 [Ehrlichia ruminantium]QLK58579.1 hypothetical protein FDZ58_01335 [Ehrlichia ruminantium]
MYDLRFPLLVAFIVSCLILYMFINFIVKYITRRKNLRTAITTTSGSNLPEHNLSERLNSADTKLQEIDSPYEYSKSDLSGHNLSEMFNSADTKLQKIDSPYKYNIILHIDSTIVVGPVIQLKYEGLKKDAKNNPLVKQHIQYLQKNRNDNTPYTINRAILGASLEGIFSKYVGKNKPDMALIHHMINHIYTKDFMDLLSNIVDQGIPDKEKYTAGNLSFTPKITLRYISSSPKKFFIDDVEFYKKLTTTQDNTFHSTFTGNIHFLVSQSEDDPELLEYSEGEVSFIPNNISNKPEKDTKQSDSETQHTCTPQSEDDTKSLKYSKAETSLTSDNTLNELTEDIQQQRNRKILVLPSFTVYTHAAEQIHDNIPQLDTITTTTLHNRETDSYLII